MKVWTIQPVDVFNLIEEKGVYRCDGELSPHLKDKPFQEAYEWLVEKMSEKIGPAPNGVKFPVWAWHTRNAKRKKPDLRESGYTKRGEEMVCIELEIPDEEVVLSDFDNWHSVLNKYYCDESNNEEEWDEIQNWLDGLSNEERDQKVKSSWDQIFDIKYRKDEWRSNGIFIQATFWELKKEYIRNFWVFKAK